MTWLEIKAELEELTERVEQEDFWNDLEYAQKVMKKKKTMESTIEAINALTSAFKDIEELIEMAEEEDDESMAPEIQSMFDKLREDLAAMRVKTLLTGKYDGCGAIVSIHAGTGGDAMDWASMAEDVHQMVRKKGYIVKMIDLQDDTEAGIKSAYTYSRKEKTPTAISKTKKGVHRLVENIAFQCGR